jgi:hypothetical protein
LPEMAAPPLAEVHPLGDVVRETRGDYPSNARHDFSKPPLTPSSNQYGVPGIPSLDVFFKGPQNPLPPKWAGKRDLAGLYLGFCGQGEKSEISELRPLS